MSDKKYKILTEFVSDLSSETKDVLYICKR